ncbi:hypothetical protein ATANTOWER_004146 [Ataeniobius toweri]|uniref:Uncharacterized protein n=1 Tax=Ataeniobius toweri TaxID=208326 RepID=A0ABU7A490_9TELE|nr:hypothetical protein [Ataeniobius toweri]
METRGRYKRRDRQRGFDLKRMKLGREKSNSDRNLLPGGGEIILKKKRSDSHGGTASERGRPYAGVEGTPETSSVNRFLWFIVGLTLSESGAISLCRTLAKQRRPNIPRFLLVCLSHTD